MSRKKPNATNFCYFVGNFVRHQLLHRIAIYFEAPCATTPTKTRKGALYCFCPWAPRTLVAPLQRTSCVVCVVVPVLRFPGAEQQECNAAERLDAGRYAEHFAPLSARRVLVRQRSDHLHNNNNIILGYRATRHVSRNLVNCRTTTSCTSNPEQIELVELRHCG